MSNQSVSEELILLIRRLFFKDREKEFFQQRDLILQAITYPAHYLHGRGVGMDEEPYRDLVKGVILDIHSKSPVIKFFGAYFLGAIQKHMVYRGEKYYYEGVKARNRLTPLVEGIMAAKAFAPRSREKNCEALALAHTALKTSRKRRIAPSAGKQLSLI